MSGVLVIVFVILLTGSIVAETDIGPPRELNWGMSWYDMEAKFELYPTKSSQRERLVGYSFDGYHFNYYYRKIALSNGHIYLYLFDRRLIQNNLYYQ